MKDYYKPLPDCVTIKDSFIEGLGLFAVEDIKEGHLVGISHVKDDRCEDGYQRTPLGGFYNYDDNPNCENIVDGTYLLLKTKKNIKVGDEITVKYLLYDPTK